MALLITTNLSYAQLFKWGHSSIAAATLYVELDLIFLFHEFSIQFIYRKWKAQPECTETFLFDYELPRLELVSKELNHLAAILHVYARGLIFMK